MRHFMRKSIHVHVVCEHFTLLNVWFMAHSVSICALLLLLFWDWGEFIERVWDFRMNQLDNSPARMCVKNFSCWAFKRNHMVKSNVNFPVTWASVLRWSSSLTTHSSIDFLSIYLRIRWELCTKKRLQGWV